jgi:hypothetical protein
MKITLKLLIVLVVAVLFVGAYSGSNRHPIDKTTPVVFEVTPGNAGPNQLVRLTVVLDHPAATGVVVSIGCTDPYAFSDLDTEIIVPANESQTTFTATTSSTFTNWACLTASANGGAAIAYPGSQ